jgi:hypothetical protein
MEMRIFNTPTKASLKILELILLLPFTRSLKVMGTSAMRKSRLLHAVLHFDLEGIADESDLVQRQGLQGAGLVADEAGGGIAHAEPEHQAHVLARRSS